jgi:hypothetical protein
MFMSWRNKGFVYSSGEPSGGGDPPEESTAMKKMRLDIEKANNEAKEANAKLKEATEKLRQSELEKLGEIERVKAENGDLAKKVNELTGTIASLEPNLSKKTELEGFVATLYDSKLAEVPEAIREKVKTLTLVEGDPVVSMSRLNEAFDLVVGNNTQGKKAGNVAIPGAGPGKPGEGDEKKYDPKTISWGDAFGDSAAKLAAQKASMFG